MENLEKIYERSSEVRYRILEGQAVVVRQDVAQVFVLSEVGARVLELLDGKHNLTQVRDLLLLEYEVDEAQLEQDLNEYINGLKEAGIIHCSEDW
jgi:asparagine synthetase A